VKREIQKQDPPSPADLIRQGSRAAGAGAVAGACVGAFVGALSGALAATMAWSALTAGKQAWRRYQDR